MLQYLPYLEFFTYLIMIIAFSVIILEFIPRIIRIVSRRKNIEPIMDNIWGHVTASENPRKINFCGNDEYRSVIEDITKLDLMISDVYSLKMDDFFCYVEKVENNIYRCSIKHSGKTLDETNIILNPES